jgi:hypothetical protein
MERLNNIRRVRGIIIPLIMLVGAMPKKGNRRISVISAQKTT